MKDNWKQQMQRKMEGYSEPAPLLQWDVLEKALPKPKKTRTIPVAIWWSAAAAAAAALVVGAVLLTKSPRNPSSPMEDSIAENTPVPEVTVPAQDSVGEEKETVTPETGKKTQPFGVVPSGRNDSVRKGTATSGSGRNDLLADNLPSSEVAPKDDTAGENAGGENEEDGNKGITGNGDGPVVSGDDPAASTGNDDSAPGNKGNVDNAEDKKDKEETPTTKPYIRTADPFAVQDEPSGSKGRPLTAMAFVSNGAGLSGGGEASSPMMMALPSADTYGFSALSAKSNSAPVLFTNDNPVTRDADHRQPLRAGIKFRYNIDNHWGIESGITYSYLSSTLRSGSRSISSDVEQRLSYIGIPLNVTRYLWSGNRWGVYASAGGMVEKMVKGRRSFSTSVGGESDASSVENVSIRPLQYSVNASAGIEYRIWNGIGLYAEPSVDYHFDNGSDIPTIYSDRPLNFALGVGLRFDFGGRR